MRKRKYVYSYSPAHRRVLIETSGRRSWLPVSIVIVLVAGMTVAGLRFAGRGEGSQRANGGPALAGIEAPDKRPQAPEAGTDRGQPNAGSGHVANEKPPTISGLATAVIEEPCGAVLHSKNANLRLPPASLTKIATALIAAARADPSEIVRVRVDGGKLSEAEDATVMGLRPGQRVSVRDLLYGMLLPSGNDAAIALAEYVSGDVPEFVDLMNDKVRELGLRDTHFTNPHGLDDPALYTSAHDVAMLGRELLHTPTLAQIVGTRSYQPAWDGPSVVNLNLLLGQYAGALGVKTGYTDTARHTIVAAAERNGRRLIVSVLRSEDVYVDAIALLDWGFAAPSACGGTSEEAVAAAR